MKTLVPNRPWTWLLVLVGVAIPSWAQRGNLYAFAAPGAITCCGYSESTVHAGLGGEWTLHKYVGVGLEAGALGPTSNFSNAIGVASANGYAHLLGADRKVDPFLTGGYSMLWRTGYVNAGNVGAGVNYWLARRLGVRLEVRDHLRYSSSTVQYWGVRFGVTLR